MKYIFIFTIVFTTNGIFAQSKAETDVLHLSSNIFNWEVENKINLLEALLSDKFSVVTSRGEVQTKEQYLATLRSGNFKHDSIVVEQSNATIVDNTATVIGKGWFHMTVSGNKLHRHLRYMEVFAKDEKDWKLIALYASTLAE
jgi:hypothetical protein